MGKLSRLGWTAGATTLIALVATLYPPHPSSESRRTESQSQQAGFASSHVASLVPDAALQSAPSAATAAHSQNWRVRLEKIAHDDSAGMNQLQEEAAEWAKVQGPELEREMRAIVREADPQALRTSFLIVHAMITASPEPEAPLDALLMEPEPSSARTAVEGALPSPVTVLRIHALSQYLKRLEDGRAEDLERGRAKLLPHLLETAQSSADLAIVRLATKAILRLEPQPARYLQAIRNARKPSELFAIRDLIT